MLLVSLLFFISATVKLMSAELFDQKRHETLTSQPWSTELVIKEIDTIVADINNSIMTDSSWPTHPLDAESYASDSPKWASYAGAAGVVLAMQILKRYGYNANDYSSQLTIIYSSYIKNPDVQVEPGLQLGELGILIPLLLAQPNNENAKNKLIQAMQKTVDLPLYEVTSGQTGMMHAALHLYRKTNEQCWRDVYIDGAQSLLTHWQQDKNTKQWLWPSTVFGPLRHYYGACHGIVANANILLQGIDLLNESLKETIVERTVSTLRLSAKESGRMANWQLCTKPDIEKVLVQWCHGGAGIVTAMAATTQSLSKDSLALDLLLKKTGELIWQAGPLKKGSNICHGTAGNGYAFLYLYKRWGDSIWLERARQFAMHAIVQCQSDRAFYKQGRYSLWTGDAGLAIYLHHCLHPEQAALPGLELF